MSERLVAILIHGTFAPNSPWTKSDSLLSKALTLRAGVERIEVLKWGRFNNTFSARFAASERLAQMISSLEDDTRAVVCAHSHGGAAICYALAKHPDLARKIHTAVFFATPFVSCRLLPSWRGLYTAYASAFGLVLFTLLLLTLGLGAWQLGFSPIILGGWNRWHVVLIVLQLCISELLLQIALRSNRKRLASAHELLRQSIRDARSHSCDLAPGINVKLVRISGDEASTALVFSQAAAWLVLRFNLIFAWVASHLPLTIVRLRHPIRTRFIIYVLTMPILIAMAEVPHLATHSIDPASEWAVVVMLLLVAIPVLVYLFAFAHFLMAMALLILNWFLAIPVGIISLFHASSLQFSIEPVPTGTWPFTNVAWSKYGVTRRGLFWRYSAAYDNPAVISDIVEAVLKH